MIKVKNSFPKRKTLSHLKIEDRRINRFINLNTLTLWHDDIKFSKDVLLETQTLTQNTHNHTKTHTHTPCQPATRTHTPTHTHMSGAGKPHNQLAYAERRATPIRTELHMTTVQASIQNLAHTQHTSKCKHTHTYKYSFMKMYLFTFYWFTHFLVFSSVSLECGLNIYFVIMWFILVFR